jgi:hypothetical protein
LLARRLDCGRSSAAGEGRARRLPLDRNARPGGQRRLINELAVRHHERHSEHFSEVDTPHRDRRLALVRKAVAIARRTGDRQRLAGVLDVRGSALGNIGLLGV